MARSEEDFSIVSRILLPVFPSKYSGKIIAQTGKLQDHRLLAISGFGFLRALDG
jgi:hypothetical protein